MQHVADGDRGARVVGVLVPLGDGGQLVDVDTAVANEDADHRRRHGLGHGVARHHRVAPVVGVRAVAVVDDGAAVHDDHGAHSLCRTVVERGVGRGIDLGPIDALRPGRFGPLVGRPRHTLGLLGELAEGIARRCGRLVAARARGRRRARRLGVASGIVTIALRARDRGTADEQHEPDQTNTTRRPSTLTSPRPDDPPAALWRESPCRVERVDMCALDVR